MKYRWGGCAMIIAGVFLGYTCIYSPIAEVSRHEQGVSISLKGTVFVPFCVVVGLLYMARGNRTEDAFGTRGHPTGFAWLVGGGLLVMGFFLYLIVKDHLERAGYRF